MENKLKSIKTHKENVCPSCDKELDAATSEHGEDPNKGDLSICTYCCMINVFEEDRKLRAISEEELKAIEDGDPELYTSLKRSVSMVKQIIKERSN